MFQNVRFNQDCRHAVFCGRKGFSIYAVTPTFTRRMNEEGLGGMEVVEMLYSTSLLGLTSSGDLPGTSPRVLKLWNSQTRETICDIPFASTIVAVRLNKQFLVTCLEWSVHIFDLATMNSLYDLAIPCGTKGVVALTTAPNSSLLAYRRDDEVVSLFDCKSLITVCQIKAHKSGTSIVEFTRSGTLLATASRKGTIIRVFSTIPQSRGQIVATFRRGNYPCPIQSLSFSPMDQYLAAGSWFGTVHIFAMNHKTFMKDVTGDYCNNREDLKGMREIGEDGQIVTWMEESRGPAVGTSSHVESHAETRVRGYQSDPSSAKSQMTTSMSNASNVHREQPPPQISSSWIQNFVGMTRSTLIEGSRALFTAKLPQKNIQYSVALISIDEKLTESDANCNCGNPSADSGQMEVENPALLRLIVCTLNGNIMRYSFGNMSSSTSTESQPSVRLCILEDETNVVS